MAVEGGEIVIRAVIPVVEDEHETFPVLVHIHGGGKCATMLRRYDKLMLPASGY